ncbi:MAG: acyl-CoA dehydrogenase [Chloroflexi bacterium]|nr:acyl-CoA dehydrogenase [Chloroflexota bacterium]MBV9898544.1 acyl-CoA dehydrogenase [Chloroflexota bacterium]
MATVVASSTPTIDEMVQRARALLPKLRERAAATEALGQLPPETVGDFKTGGFFRVLQPRRFGGMELDYGRTQLELCTTLGQACGSAAWVQMVVACHAWCLAMFPDAAQQAVWRDDPETLVGSAFGFTTGKGRPVEGGYWVEGDWVFSSGSNLCDWIILGTRIQQEGPPKQIWTLLPRSDWEMLDTWHAAGLKGSASNDIRVKGAFVPQEFSLDIGFGPGGAPTPGSLVNPNPMYALPLAGFFYFNVTTEALGIARGAIDAFSEQLAGRGDRPNLYGRHMRLAESSAEVDAAEALIRSDVERIDRILHEGVPVEPAFQAKLGRDLSFMVRLCSQAVDRLTGAVGAHGMDDDNPVHRASRDIHAIANHAVNNWEHQALNYSRARTGLPPVPMF